MKKVELDKLGKEDITEIEFKGKKIKNLVTLAEWDNHNDINLKTTSGFQEFIAWVFEKESELLTKEKVIGFFKTNTFEYWMSLTTKDIHKIEFQGKKITSLAILAEWKNPNKVVLTTPSGFQEFIAWVFEKESELLTKEKVLEFFKAKTFEDWMKLRGEDITEIEFKGKKIISLAKLAGWKNPNKVALNNPSGFQEFIGWIFERKLETITKEQVLEFFKTKSFEDWMSLTAKDILEIKFQGKKITSLASLAGWDKPNGIRLQIPSGFQEFIVWVFEKEIRAKRDKKA